MQWSTPAFGFVKLSDAFTTGSSIMPQKRNPDAAELIRGKTGRVLGDFVALATVVKGLVLTYGTDLQEDKERVFDAADTLELSPGGDGGDDRRPDRAAGEDARRREPGFPTATDLADWVVRVLKKPFREAHHIAGSIVKRAEDKGVTLDKLPLAEMQAVEPAITAGSVQGAVAGSLGQFAHEPGRHRAGAGEGTDCTIWREHAEMKNSVLLIAAAGAGGRRLRRQERSGQAGRHSHAQGRARSLQAALSDRPLGHEPMNHFHYKDGVLCAEDVALDRLARRGRHAFLLLFQRHPGAALQGLRRRAAGRTR